MDFMGLRFIRILKTMHLQQLKGMQSFNSLSSDPPPPPAKMHQIWSISQKTSQKLCYFRLLPNLAQRKLVDLANHLPSSSPLWTFDRDTPSFRKF